MAKVEDILGATLYLGHTMQVEYTARCSEWNALPAMPVLLAPLLASSKKTASLAYPHWLFGLSFELAEAMIPWRLGNLSLVTQGSQIVQLQHLQCACSIDIQVLHVLWSGGCSCDRKLSKGQLHCQLLWQKAPQGGPQLERVAGFHENLFPQRVGLDAAHRSITSSEWSSPRITCITSMQIWPGSFLVSFWPDAFELLRKTCCSHFFPQPRSARSKHCGLRRSNILRYALYYVDIVSFFCLCHEHSRFLDTLNFEYLPSESTYTKALEASLVNLPEAIKSATTVHHPRPF